MAKKLFVPDRVAANMQSDAPQTEIPKAVQKALPPEEENKNTERPFRDGCVPRWRDGCQTL